MTDLWELTATELIETFEAGAASPVEATRSCLERIERTDGDLNAVLSLLEDSALAQAAESERRWRNGTARLLEGVPYGLKDIIATEGVTTTGGSALYRHNVPAKDAALAARLSDAGGVLLSKLHTFEFACGGAENRTFGRCRNPWDLTRTTGGSSSGSGAAVASRQLPLAIGTDTGGSIRIPAAYCGITGLKPTYGRVPRDGVMGLSWSLDHAGPMTRSVQDAARMLEAIAGFHPADQESSRRPVPPYTQVVPADLADVRLGRPRGWFEDSVSAEVAQAFDRAIGELVALGATVVDVDLPDVELWEAAGLAVMHAEMLSYHQHHAYDIEARDPMGAGLLADAPFVSAVDYLRGLRYRHIAQRQLEEAMAGVDALVTPSVSEVAPELAVIADTVGSATWLATAMRNSIPFNVTGSPALCMPTGLSGGEVPGLPTSLQLIARPHDEATLIAIGAAYQASTEHHKLMPVHAVLG
jgi:aspartyl-tRNA(Asn)/glutamyl-tRNA(Gln) amidotransferase subunit A